MKVTMIGLGKLGKPVAEAMAQQHTVSGYDTRLDRRPLGVTEHSSLWSAVQDSAIVFVAVPTPHDARYGGETPTSHLPKQDFSYEALDHTIPKIVEYADPNATIVVISTVLPGTLRPRSQLWGCADRLVYNPYLIAMGTVTDDFLQPDLCMIGTAEGGESAHTQRLVEFYRTQWQREPHITCGTWEECESIKIFHNTYITAKIQIANMIQDITQRIGHSNPTRIAEALRHAERIVSDRYMEPGMGDGGACHPRDNIALSWLAQRLDLPYDPFQDIMQWREAQTELMARHCASYDLPVVIMGKTFKGGVDLTDGSPALLLGHYLEQQGVAVTYDGAATSDQPSLYVLTLPGEHHDHAFVRGSTVLDIYRQFRSEREDLTVKWYGVAPH